MTGLVNVFHEVEQYKLFALQLNGPQEGNPYVDVQLSARFSHVAENGSSASIDEVVNVHGFYRGHGNYEIRFMASTVGSWVFETISNVPELNSITGGFTVTPATEGNHGRVLRAIDVQRLDGLSLAHNEAQYQFAYEDGTAFYPFGTTSYAWTNQSEQVQNQTVETLSRASFNKMRMCIFPKFYDFNSEDPELFAYDGDMGSGFDPYRFNEAFWENLDKRIAQLDALGIEADIILLHPYDKEKWGFSKMSREEDIFYLTYVARRYAAYKNIWWSFANEYDLMPWKTREDWRLYARTVMANDPFNHLRSIHQCITMYDHSEPWITHVSVQRIDVTRTTECVSDWRTDYGKPVVVDEAGYEGDIYWGWGNLTAEELNRRYWEGVLRGGYVTHGETYLGNPNIWWAHGGKLYGQSPERIAFLRDVREQAPRNLAPLDNPELKAFQYWDATVAVGDNGYRLIYFGFNRPAYREINIKDLCGEGNFVVDVIDTWNMTITRLPGTYSDTVHCDLGKQYMAIRIQKA
ncbi:DUF5605 domain-containing protein [Alloscardovia sp. HMSC034E08]|uniref:DUF5605 domain-containing protein n=1 Tax=Alloscardovia sp. HMSC034E08 TaxID=1739413 RepID=UPI0008AC2880|nr:DUF5605 domain-containing protein [Alloscardovia sp. HMSC034E08]OFQ98273.1 alpha-L-rhamnosidase [Alloscardovia sp. HMSC034E08]